MAGFAELPTQSSISAVLSSATSGYLKVTIETAENGRITVLHFEPFVAPEEAPDCPDVTANEAAPVANTPPANTPPANTPPANAPPANTPPANAPPANAPPANNPTGGQ
jgi:hypothetical protein